VSANNLSLWLKYAQLQMAAEARSLRSGMLQPQRQAALEEGNARASRFTPTQAAEFARKYEVVAHQVNTSD